MSADWWAVAVSVLAAAAAVWQAFEARKARSDAQASAKSAAENEKRALESSEAAASAAARSAKAQERLAEVVEGQSVKPTWKVKKKSPTVWRVVNASPHEVIYVSVELEDERLRVPEDAEGEGFDSLGPGEGFDMHLDYEEGGRDWASFTLLWTNDRSDQVTERLTLRWRPPVSLVF